MGKPIDLHTAETAPFEPLREHAELMAVAGKWEGTTTTWFDPSNPPEQALTHALVEPVLGGRFLRIQYTGTVAKQPHAGEMLVAYEQDEARYSLAWIDSFHTGTALMLSTGEARPDRTISVLGSYAAGDQRWGWRTVLHPKPDAFVIEAFNISPSGQEYPALRTRLLPM